MSTNKSFSNETSERYARALFEVVNESSELVKTENSLIEFLNIYDSSPELVNFLKKVLYFAQVQFPAKLKLLKLY